MRFFPHTVTRARFAAGVWTAGAWVQGAETQTDQVVDVQPLTGRELQTLPESERERDVRKVYSDTGVFRTASQHSGDGWASDQVIFEGVRYEVRAVEDNGRLLPHQKSRMMRLKE